MRLAVATTNSKRWRGVILTGAAAAGVDLARAAAVTGETRIMPALPAPMKNGVGVLLPPGKPPQ